MTVKKSSNAHGHQKWRNPSGARKHDFSVVKGVLFIKLTLALVLPRAILLHTCWYLSDSAGSWFREGTQQKTTHLLGFAGLFLCLVPWTRSPQDQKKKKRKNKRSTNIITLNVNHVLTELTVNNKYHLEMLIYTARPLKIAQDQYKRINRNFTQGVNTKEEQRAVTRGSLAACYCFYTTGNERIQWESLCERLGRPSESLFHPKVLQQAHDLGLTKGFLPTGPRGKLPALPDQRREQPPRAARTPTVAGRTPGKFGSWSACALS